jgi:signal transduction histidine kinase
VSVLLALTVGIAGFVPDVRAFFQLEVSTVALAYVPAFGLGITTGILQQRGVLDPRTFGLLAVIDSGLGQAFAWSLVACSSWPGSGLMFAFPAVLACYHGHALCSPPERPFIAVAGCFALLAALLVNHDSPHLALYGVGGPLAIVGSLVLGRISALERATARERDALREAVQAQLLRERTRLLEESSEALVRVLGSSHDAGNALSSVTVSVERLGVLARRPMSDVNRDAIGSQASEVVQALRRLREMFGRGRDVVEHARHGRQRVACLALAKTLARDVGARFSGVNVTVTTENEAGELDAMVCDGETTLSRILTNLTTNAAEGDGESAASEIEIRLRRDAHDRVVIEVVDDGPGLPPGYRDDPFATFRTSKRGGTGLGLYTARQLAESCGGTLRLLSSATRGVRATLELPSGHEGA